MSRPRLSWEHRIVIRGYPSRAIVFFAKSLDAAFKWYSKRTRIKPGRYWIEYQDEPASRGKNELRVSSNSVLSTEGE